MTTPELHTAEMTIDPEAGAQRLTVVVADDHPLFREGIVRALESSEAFTVVGQANDGREALDTIRALDPDVALVDVRMPKLDGIDVVAALARSGSDVPVVLLSAFEDAPLITAGVEAGAAAFLLKTASRESVCLEVAAAARTPQTHSPRALHGAADLGPARLPGWLPRLTRDEHTLLQLAAGGWGKPELAFLLDLDEPALRRRQDAILAKLGADDLEDAVQRARALHLVR